MKFIIVALVWHYYGLQAQQLDPNQYNSRQACEAVIAKMVVPHLKDPTYYDCVIKPREE